MGANTYKHISIKTYTNTSDIPRHNADRHADTYRHTAQTGTYKFMDTGHNTSLFQHTTERGTHNRTHAQM